MEDAQQHFQARIECLTEALDYVEQWSTARRLPAELTAKLLLIVEELFTNATVHGGASALEDAICLHLGREGAEVKLQFVAGGSRYDPFAHLQPASMEMPLAERPIGGVGVVLVAGLASRVDYRRASDRNCISVWLPCD